MLGKSITKNSLILGAFALLTAAIVALTFQSTEKKIAFQETQAAQKALLEIVPKQKHDNNMLATTYTLPAKAAKALNVPENSHAFVALSNAQPVATIIPSVATDGYSGDIKLIVGVNFDGSIAGVRVLSHKETPGLGDKIDLNKSQWILSFNGHSLGNPAAENWTVKKDGGYFDQFTGATITPRAVVNQVKNTLVVFEANKESIFKTTLNNAETSP